MRFVTYTSPVKQRGLAALLVTVILALLASIATIYANRGSLLLQKSVANNTQSVMAQQAAEVGINDFLRQIRLDVIAIQGGTAGVILQANTTPPAVASCAPPAAPPMPFQITATYADGTGMQFGTNQYFMSAVNLSTAITNTAPSLAYRVQAKLINSKIYITSQGLVGAEAGLTSNGDNSDSFATIRRVIPIKAGLNLPNTAVTIGGYADSEGSINIGVAVPGMPRPQCAVAYGSSYSYRGAPVYDCSMANCAPLNDPSLQTDLFGKIFNDTKANIKATATQVLPSCTNQTITVGDNDVVWITGDASGCTIAGSSKAIVVVQGNVTGALNATGFIYATNVFQNGGITVTGSLAIESSWDKGSDASYLSAGRWMYPNHVNDSSTALFSDGSPSGIYGSAPANWSLNGGTHTATGAIRVFYEPKVLQPFDPKGPVLSAGSWIDF